MLRYIIKDYVDRGALSVVGAPIAVWSRSAPTLAAVHRRAAVGVKKGICIHNRRTIFHHRQYIQIYYEKPINNHRIIAT
jgi:hypothetical protein